MSVQTIAKLLVLAATASVAQTTAALPSFEVASVKPSGPVIPGWNPGNTDRPGQFNYPHATVKALLTRAFALRDEQVVGPAWIAADGFDVVAKVPAGAAREQVNQMIRNLLVERFGLGYHMETRDLPVYEMVVSKGGLRIRETKLPEGAQAPTPGQPGSGPPHLVLDKDGWEELAPGVPGYALVRPRPNGERRISARMQTVATLVPLIQLLLGRAVIDKTGLTGTYDFNLDFAGTPRPVRPGWVDSEPPSGQAGPAEPTADAGPPLAAALESQLGLRLESKKDPLDVLVVDKVNRTPTEN
jgi:uncharacterized protein (TIGR03435 family)